MEETTSEKTKTPASEPEEPGQGLERKAGAADNREDAPEPAQASPEVSEDLPFLKDSPAGKSIHGQSDEVEEMEADAGDETDADEGSKQDMTRIDLEQLREKLEEANVEAAEEVPPLTEPVPPPKTGPDDEEEDKAAMLGETAEEVEDEKEEGTEEAPGLKEENDAEESPEEVAEDTVEGEQEDEKEIETDLPRTAPQTDAVEAEEETEETETAERDSAADGNRDAETEADTAKVSVASEERSGEETDEVNELEAEEERKAWSEDSVDQDQESLGTPSPSLAADDQPLGTPSPSLAADDQTQEQEQEQEKKEVDAAEKGSQDESAGREHEPGREKENDQDKEKEEMEPDAASGTRAEPIAATAETLTGGEAGSDSAEDDPWFGDSYPIIPAETSLVAVEGKKGGGCWTVFATIFVIATLLLLAALVGGAAYLWFKRDTLMAKAEDSFRERIESRGYHFDHSGMDYQFPRGVVLSDFQLYADEAKERPVITCSDVGVDADMASLLKGGEKDAPLRGELSFSDSTLTLHGGEEGDLTVEKVSGRVLASRDSLQIETLRAPVAGAMVHIEGEVALEPGSGAFPALPLDQSVLDQGKEWLAFTSEGAPPRIDLRVTADAADPDSAKVTGRLSGSDFTWRGLAVDSASVPFEGDPAAQRWDARGLLVSAAGGTVAGNVEIVDGTLRLGDVESTADPVQLAKALWPEIAEHLGSIELVDNPRITATGAVPLENPADCELALGVQHWKGFLAGGGEKKIPVSRLGGDIAIAGRQAEFHEFRFALFDGDSVATGKVDFGGEGWIFDGMLVGTGIDLAEIAATAGIDNRLLRGEGRFSFRGTGGGKASSWRGNGDIFVDLARLNAFPVVGPSQAFLGNLVPLFASQDESRLGAHFQIESGVLITSDLEALSDTTGLKASAQVNLAEQQTQFRATGFVMGELGVKTGLNEQPIAIEGKGDMNSPSLAIISYPKALADASVQTALGMSAEAKAKVNEAIGTEEPEDAGEGEESDSEETEGTEESESPGAETETTEADQGETGAEEAEQMTEAETTGESEAEEETEETSGESDSDDEPEPESEPDEPKPIRAQPIQATPTGPGN